VGHHPRANGARQQGANGERTDIVGEVGINSWLGTVIWDKSVAVQMQRGDMCEKGERMRGWMGGWMEMEEGTPDPSGWEARQNGVGCRQARTHTDTHTHRRRRAGRRALVGHRPSRCLHPRAGKKLRALCCSSTRAGPSSWAALRKKPNSTQKDNQKEKKMHRNLDRANSKKCPGLRLSAMHGFGLLLLCRPPLIPLYFLFFRGPSHALSHEYMLSPSA
jgi:hypothetical protein